MLGAQMENCHAQAEDHAGIARKERRREAAGLPCAGQVLRDRQEGCEVPEEPDRL